MNPEADHAEYAVKERSSRLPLSEQEKCIAELHDVIGVFTKRLEAVLTPIPERDPSTAEDKASPVQSPLAEQLSRNNYGVRKATKKLEALMERYEA